MLNFVYIFILYFEIKSTSRCVPHTVCRSVLHFLAVSGGIACWVAELNVAFCPATRAKKWKYKFKYIFHRLEWGSHPQPVGFTVTLVPLRHDWPLIYFVIFPLLYFVVFKIKKMVKLYINVYYNIISVMCHLNMFFFNKNI